MAPYQLFGSISLLFISSLCTITLAKRALARIVIVSKSIPSGISLSIFFTKICSCSSLLSSGNAVDSESDIRITELDRNFFINKIIISAESFAKIQ